MDPATIEALIVLAAKYGPGLVASIIAIFRNPSPTLADVEAAFGKLKAYDDYGIKPPAPVTVVLPDKILPGTTPVS